MKRKTKKELEALLKSMGLKKQFKPYQKKELGDIILKNSRPVKVINGLLKGNEITIFDCKTFFVWTSNKKLANEISKQYNIQVVSVEKEAELYVPASLADEILPKFGAKVKRTVSPESLIRLRENIKIAQGVKVTAL